jgi:hypothetical protein
MKTAYMHIDDGYKWLRVIDGEKEHDEPLTGWAYVINLCHGFAEWRNSITGETIKDQTS